ncbi:hypothetical protein LguiA_009604 [Lonicera macranthoides]
MTCSMKTNFTAAFCNETLVNNGSIGVCPSTVYVRPMSTDFMGKPMLLSDHNKGFAIWNVKAPSRFFVHAQASICVSRSQQWWEKTHKPNMIEIRSAQQLVDTLSNAGDRLVVVDFHSPGCGGCKSLHPKICQLAESNSNAVFLKVNYEELKTMCHCLHIHVLPFFRFYRGAEGRLCSFSCTNATIKKFKDAMGKYGTDRCCLGPAKGLDESELLRLASIGQISTNLPAPSSKEGDKMEDLVLKGIDLPNSFDKESNNKMGLKEENALLIA